ncbi:MAG: hypothetical protein ACRDN9_20860 [Streptosporangiaceae bacterium]
MVKKAVVLLAVGFAVYYLFTAPEGAAVAVRGAADAVINGFGQLMRFFSRLAS